MLKHVRFTSKKKTNLYPPVGEIRFWAYVDVSKHWNIPSYNYFSPFLFEGEKKKIIILKHLIVILKENIRIFMIYV
jgi:hypothetical protein